LWIWLYLSSNNLNHCLQPKRNIWTKNSHCGIESISNEVIWHWEKCWPSLRFVFMFFLCVNLTIQSNFFKNVIETMVNMFEWVNEWMSEIFWNLKQTERISASCWYVGNWNCIDLCKLFEKS
jgi:hypothetical protein